MIYKKRQGEKGQELYEASSFEKEAFGFSEKGTFSENDKTEEFCKEETRHALTSKKHKRKRHSPVRAVSFLALLSAVAFFTLKKDFAKSYLQKALSVFSSPVLASQSEKYTFPDYTDKRTIYTLPFAESNIDADNTNFSENVSESAKEEDDEKESTESLAVTSQASLGASSDGIKYYPISELDLSCENPLSLSNATSFDVNLESLLQSTPKSLESLSVSSEPLVLILHTHACECYSESENSYAENEPTRCDDTDKNVVRVGEEIAETLSDFGICTVHCKTLHDKESFIDAYSESAESVREYLAKYPSIKFVLDVHRDAIIREDGESIKAVCDVAGENYAQIMFVVGTNELGHNHPDWHENLSLATLIQRQISSSYPSLCRSINLRNVPFNQQLLDGYLLLEVGTSGNTLSEALRSARAFGTEFARLIYEYDVKA